MRGRKNEGVVGGDRILLIFRQRKRETDNKSKKR